MCYKYIKDCAIGLCWTEVSQLNDTAEFWRAISWQFVIRQPFIHMGGGGETPTHPLSSIYVFHGEQVRVGRISPLGSIKYHYMLGMCISTEDEAIHISMHCQWSNALNIHMKQLIMQYHMSHPIAMQCNSTQWDSKQIWCYTTQYVADTEIVQRRNQYKYEFGQILWVAFLKKA